MSTTANQTPSVGVVTPQTVRFDAAMPLDCGQVLQSHELIYETYGQLNAEKNNAVLVCHALSGDHHAAGLHHIDDEKTGWWDSCIGPGKAIDTDKFYVCLLYTSPSPRDS